MYTHTHTYSYIYITLFTILLSKGLNRAICLRFSQFTHEKFHWEILPKVSHIVISCSKINSKLTFENFYLPHHELLRCRKMTMSILCRKTNFENGIGVISNRKMGFEKFCLPRHGTSA